MIFWSFQLHTNSISSTWKRFSHCANSKKSTFGVQEVSYLGFIINNNGIRLDPEKIEAILDWEIPQTAQQIHSFVGLCQAYNMHMQNFSEVAAPLTDLLKGCKTK